ncbi:MAG: hypothetical protein GF355_05860, partial [Candidatus Eisenbacteria bacterium]|nr:hypothetical protein [Candidatus Eisenbacteria bacterium]
LLRALLIALHSRGVVSINEIHRQARAGRPPQTDPEAGDNVQLARRWDEEEKQRIHDITLEHAAGALSRADVDDLVNLTRKREEAQTLEEIASLQTVSSGLLREKVKSFCRLPPGQTRLPERESMATRVALIRRIISDQLEFIGVARRHLTIRDFDDLVDRIIGHDERSGLIGGKAGGMILARKILENSRANDPKAPETPIESPRSYFLRSDVIEEFLAHNGLQHLQDHKYKSIDEIRNEYPMLVELFKNADFPAHIADRFRAVLEEIGEHPLIVRSSSLLEDRFGTAFAGKYRSVFVMNQGPLDKRLTELLGAIAEVYASTLHPDPISYRRRHNLLDYSENMAVLIQELVGARMGTYFLPVWAGVAFSRNLYRRNPRVRPEDGLARLVFGLGTRAVDRVSNDFPRMVPLGMPTLRPEVKAVDLMRSSQQEADVVNLHEPRFESVPVKQVISEAGRIAGLGQVVSIFQHGFVRPLMGDGFLDPSAEPLVTFDRWAQATPYPAFLRWCLQTLENAYGCPVDIEFAYDGERFHLLQCRPVAAMAGKESVQIPGGIAPERIVFSANRDVMTGQVHGVAYVVLIEPEDYYRLASDDRRIGVAQIVRQLNEKLADAPFLLMGPGRWGSRDLRMGIRVGYADINNARMLMEIARRKEGYEPEVSYGSHFFRDLVESDISYLPLYPDDPEVVYNTEFLHGAENQLASLVPEAEDYADVVRVIHVPAAAGGKLLNVDLDGDNQRALAYLA